MKSVSDYFLLPVASFLLTLFCVLFSAFVCPLLAQTSLAVKGVVADSITLKTLGYVTIGFKNDKNETIKAGLTNEDGSFELNSLYPGKYILSIVAMGYQRKSISIDLRENTDLFTIYIMRESTSLDGVTVLADKPLVKMDIDKISYDLQADPESKVNSVLEMMRKVPLLSLDHEENIQLKGSGNYRILINGRPSAMMERSPKDILRSMPASTIQSIEVITNPPAKYDGEGLTGIINIVTIKKIDNGYNGSANLNYRFPSGGPGVGSSFNFKQGKWGMSANLGGHWFIDPLAPNSNVRTITGANASVLSQAGARKYNSRNAYTTSQFSYEIDSLNLISAQFGYNLGAFNQSGFLNSLFNNSGGLLEAYKTTNENEGNRRGTDISANYQMGFKSDKQRLLTLSYRYLEYFDLRDMDTRLSERTNYDLPDFVQFNESGSDEQTFQVDYVQPLKSLSIEAGVKGIMRSNYSDFNQSFKSTFGSYIIDPSLSNKYDNRQNVFSLYNSWQLKLKSWGVKAGARLERTDLVADFMSSATQVDQRYLNLLPSLSISRTLKDKNSLSFGFTQRIQRPGIWDLNPNVDRSNPNLERTGNPALKPVVANNFQFTFNSSQKTSFSVILSHSFTNNAIQYVILLDPATNINRITLGNNGSNKTTGVNINIRHPLNSKWTANFSTNLYYAFVEGYVDGNLTKNTGIKGNLSVSSGYSFANGWRVNGNAEYRLTPEILLQGAGISIFFCGFNVSKDLIKERLSLSGSINNPFTKYMVFPNNIKGLNYELVNSGRGYFRSFSYSLNYKFGKLKSQIAKNKRGINNDDVQGGARQ